VDRELTYQVPFERLCKLGRKAGRTAYPRLRLLGWLVLGAFLGALMLVNVFGDEVERWQASVGLPPLTALIAIIVAGIAGVVALRRAAAQETKLRANLAADVHMRKDDGGVHVATDQIEYYLKWPGISQVFLEPDGVVLSHASLFFLIPDRAFADMAERDGFIRDVYARLGEDARGRSQRGLRNVLEVTG
jgi:hypothetical protein